MNFKVSGINWKTNMRTKTWWIKLGGAILLSNVFFFLLFSPSETKNLSHIVPEGWVELEVRAELLTPFHSGKKVLLIHRQPRKSVTALLDKSPAELEGRFTVLVKEEDASALLMHERWEIVPFLKTLTFAPESKGISHEIRY